MEEDDVFEDTISVTSEGPRGKELISLSRFTIYHSAQDLHQNDEEDDKLHTGEESYLVEKQEDLDNISITKGPNMFSDGMRTVDFVLVWTDENEKASPHSVAITRQKRSSFERNLEDEGLVLEHEHVKNVHFVKLHATHEVLCRYSEILKLRLPMKEIPGETIEAEPASGIMDSLLWRFLNFVHVDTEIFKPIELKFTAEFSRDKTYLFDMNSNNFFSPSVRVTVVDYILERNKFESPNKKDPFSFGVSRLINEGVYKAAYPLHDGDYRQSGCMRNLLFYEWASVIKWIKFQPVDHIKEYFGVKFGLYFAWLGFYTHMLILASVVGLICFFYGLATMFDDNLSNDICNKDLNITMCPLCDKRCDYWQLHETCGYARISYLFDNPFTVFFAVFMSFWATLFLELWKRYSADVTHRWGLTGFDLQAEHPRPQYYARLKNANEKINVVTNLREPCVPFWKVRVPATLLSYSIMILLASVAVGAVFGVVLYRMSLLAGRILFTDTYGVMSSVTAALINLVLIMILNWFYDWLAVHLTELEVLRTQTEFDNSLTLKIYLFQFVNYYTSIFYIAFLKGKFVGYPAKYNRILGLRQEECAPGGCLMELCIQLAIIMVGKQALNSILEMVIPFLYKWFNTLRVKAGVVKEEEKAVSSSQWAKDYTLLDWGPRGLFPEYLEMVLQYGFVTIFVAAFPLAPVFALINNVLEMRLDAKKFLKFYRRPVPSRVKNIGVWFRIMDVIARMSVVTNAFIIAFSSNFIPRLVYIMTVSKNHTDVGYLEHSLAYFNTSDFDMRAAPLNPSYNVSVCRYAEYRYNHTMPPELKYKRPPIYWHILAARLAFVVVFQNIVGMVMTAVQWCIPDMSRKLRDDIRREAYLTNEMIIKQEMVRARGHLNRPPDSEQFIEHEKVREANGSKGDNLRLRRDPERNSPVDFV